MLEKIRSGKTTETGTSEEVERRTGFATESHYSEYSEEDMVEAKQKISHRDTTL